MFNGKINQHLEFGCCANTETLSHSFQDLATCGFKIGFPKKLCYNTATRPPSHPSSTVLCKGEQRDLDTQLMMQSFWKTLGITSFQQRKKWGFPEMGIPEIIAAWFISWKIHLDG